MFRVYSKYAPLYIEVQIKYTQIMLHCIEQLGVVTKYFQAHIKYTLLLLCITVQRRYYYKVCLEYTPNMLLCTFKYKSNIFKLCFIVNKSFLSQYQIYLHSAQKNNTTVSTF